MNDIFISYSHIDVDWKNRLLRHLKVLELEGFCDVWDDQKIEMGDDWLKSIKKSISVAKIGILLVTTDFLISDFIRKIEIPELLEKRRKEGLILIPVIIKPCNWKIIPWLSSIQSATKDAAPLAKGTDIEVEDKLTQIAENIFKILQKSRNLHQSKSDIPRLLTIHNLNRRRNYVKRTSLDAELYQSIIDKNSLSFIYGPSGIGKSYLAENILYFVSEENIYQYIIKVRPQPKSTLNDFLDNIIDVIEFNEIRKLDVNEKQNEILKYIKGTSTILFIDSFEKIRKNRNITNFLESLQLPIQIVITSTILDYFEDCSFIKVGRIEPSDIKDFALQVSKKFPNYLSLNNLNWDLFQQITGGSPHLISITLALLILKNLDLAEIEEAIKDGDISISNESRILDFIWNSEMSTIGQHVIKTISVANCPLSFSIIKGMTKTNDKLLSKAIKELNDLCFIEISIVGNEKFYNVLDTVYYFIHSYHFRRSKNSDVLNNIQSRAIEYCLGFTEENGKESNNYQGFLNIKKNFQFIWAMSKLVNYNKDYSSLVKYWWNLENFLHYHGYYLNRVELGSKASEAARATNDIISYAQIMVEVAESKWLLYGDKKDVLSILDEAIMILQHTDYQYNLGIAYYYIGRIQRQTKTYKEARVNLRHALSIGTKIKSDKLIGFALNNLGNLDISLEDYNSAIRKFNKCIKIWNSLSDRVMVGVTYRNLLKVYRNQNRLTDAESVFSKAFNIFESLQIDMELGEVMLEMSALYAANNLKTEAKELLAKARIIFEKTRSVHFISLINEAENLL